MPKPSTSSRVKIRFSNPGDARVLLFERTVEVDPELVRQYGTSWCVELASGFRDGTRIRWHNGDRATILETLEREMTIMALQRDDARKREGIIRFEGES